MKRLRTNTYLVTYSGMWLGGKAVVRAKDEAHAKFLVSNHAGTTNFTDVEVTKLPTHGVLYNDNGDY